MSSAFWRCSAGQLYGLRGPDLARGPLIEDPCSTMCRQIEESLVVGPHTHTHGAQSMDSHSHAWYIGRAYLHQVNKTAQEKRMRRNRYPSLSIPKLHS